MLVRRLAMQAAAVIVMGGALLLRSGDAAAAQNASSCGYCQLGWDCDDWDELDRLCYEECGALTFESWCNEGGVCPEPYWRVDCDGPES